jgi:hypothetical protein
MDSPKSIELARLLFFFYFLLETRGYIPAKELCLHACASIKKSNEFVGLCIF